MLLAMIPLAHAIDLAPFQAVLSTHVNSSGRVDYAAIRSSAALDGYLSELATASEPTARDEKMAFWINAYNALTMDLIADNFPLGSIMELDGGKVWDTRSFPVAGQNVTLNHIEHQILRPMGDPRIHAAVNCASQGCPPMHRTAFTADNLSAELDAASATWLKANGIAVDPDASMVWLSKIFEWYGDDFVASSTVDIPNVEGTQEAAINFAATYLPDQAAYLQSGAYTVGYSTYSWKVNAQ